MHAAEGDCAELGPVLQLVRRQEAGALRIGARIGFIVVVARGRGDVVGEQRGEQVAAFPYPPPLSFPLSAALRTCASPVCLRGLFGIGVA